MDQIISVEYFNVGVNDRSVILDVGFGFDVGRSLLNDLVQTVSQVGNDLN
jgi:hypothetical protein